MRNLRTPMNLYLTGLTIVALILAAAFAGFWLGGVGIKKPPPLDRSVPPAPEEPGAPAPRETETAAENKESPPLFFYAAPETPEAFDVVSGEIAMAAEAGIHRYIIGVPLPWKEDRQALKETGRRLASVVAADPSAAILLHVDLNPPAIWREAHPDDVAQVNDAALPYPCVASEQWRQSAGQALETLVVSVSEGVHAARVQGYVLAALQQGQWRHTPGYDRSPANVSAFRAWLQARYNDDAAIQTAWDDSEVVLESVSVPPEPGPAEDASVFFPRPAMQRHVDFLTYTSQSTAKTIIEITRRFKKNVGERDAVFVPYGYTFEFLDNRAGHCALGMLLDSPVDGFISPVSYVERGLGGTGGLMGPAGSALRAGKQWLLVDDTRTGVSVGPEGMVERLAFVDLDDVVEVQRRNFALAVTHGLGLCWADPLGEGWLHDETIWQGIAPMCRTDGRLRAEPPSKTPEETTLAVVVDETSRFYQRDGTGLNAALLRECADTALRVGVPVRFYLLEDLLADDPPTAAVYLFLNAFHLTRSQRDRLHEVMAARKAAAVWMYAPGCIGDNPTPAENVSAATRMTVEAFDGPAQTGSAYSLAGRWIDAAGMFGESVLRRPLFYISDENAEVVATYRAGGKPSVAVRFLEEGWTSVFVAEPALPVALMREIVEITEAHLYAVPASVGFADTLHVAGNVFAIHAAGAGERSFDLGRDFNVRDAFHEDRGWPRVKILKLSLKNGETSFLTLDSAAQDRNPEELRVTIDDEAATEAVSGP